MTDTQSGAVPWQAAQESALLDASSQELGIVPTAPSMTTISGGGTRVGPAFRGSKRGQTLQVSAQLGWSGSVVLHGLCTSKLRWPACPSASKLSVLLKVSFMHHCTGCHVCGHTA